MADWRVRWQHFDACLLFFRKQMRINTQLKQRANHSIGLDIANHSFFDFAPRQSGSRFGYDDFLSGGHIGRAAHDLKRFIPYMDGRYIQMIGIGMRLACQHFAND